MVLRLVGGAGDIKLTKDGKVLLTEMVCLRRWLYSWLTLIHLYHCSKFKILLLL